MPHIIVKLLPGRSTQQKARLAAEITRDATAALGCNDDAVSVAFEEIRAEDWAEKVYRPDILGQPEQLYKKPGYKM